MEIRNYQPKDKYRLIELWTECGLVVPWNDPKKDIQRKYLNSPQLFFVGELNEEIVELVNTHVHSYLAEHGVQIAATYFCPHERASECCCIKPKSYFLKEAERGFHIDLGKSFAIGDHPHDIHFATRVGATGVYVLSGHGIKHREAVPADTFIADGIRDATDQILEQTLRTGL